jgi:hypothetical protein
MRLDLAPVLAGSPSAAHAGAALNHGVNPGLNPDSNPPQSGNQAKLSQNQLLMDQWLDAVTEPRFMTALAAVAMEPGMDARAISGNVDPTSVRNWAEFVDPNLYMRWQAAQLEARFGLAILNRDGKYGLLPGLMPFPFEFPVPAEFRAGDPLPPTVWSKALEGKGGVDAAREWLTIPAQDPRANHWLRAGQNYRY